MVMDAAERAALQRRTLRTLLASQIVGSAALGAAMTVGGFVVEEIVGVDTPWVGVATTAVTAGSGLFAVLLSRLMRSAGRRIGNEAGYATAAVGALMAWAAVEEQSLAGFLIGLFVYGAGSATNLLARYAATDLATPEERSRAMGLVLFASTFGAVFGPTLVTPAERLGQSWLGLDPYGGPWLFSAFFFTLAGIVVAVRLRPDPLLVWAAENQVGQDEERAPAIEVVREVLGSRRARVALMAMVVAQAVMVGVMAMSPIDMKMYDHEGMANYVVSIHIAGMYALSPWVGRYVDRRGPLVALRTGAVVLAVACGVAVLAVDDMPAMFVAMFTLGLGWTLGLIGGSTLLMESVPPARRVGVQGMADLVTAVSGGIAGTVFGLLMDWVGFAGLSLISAALTVPVFVSALTTVRQSRAVVVP